MSVMLDWLSFVVPYNGPDICGGRTITFDAFGEVKFEKLDFHPVEGSFSSKVMVKTVPLPSGNGLYISGNPSKFLQGHNLFGPFDVSGMAYDMSVEVLKTLSFLDLGIIFDIRRGRFAIKRLDITRSFRLPTTADVRLWLKHATTFASGKWQGVSDYRGKTIYLGKNSSRQTFKFYCKADEIRTPERILLESESKRSFLFAWSQGILRAELTIRGKTLRDMGIDQGFHWSEGLAERLFNMQLEKINLSGEYELEDTDLRILPARYRAAYELYKQGKLLSELYSRATYYRYKKYFLGTFGINVDVPRVQERGTVIPLIRVLRAESVPIPAEAFDLGLVHKCSNHN